MAFFLIVVFSFVFRYTWSLTVIGGIIDEKVTWRLQDSPFIAERDVLILPTGELLVEPGVEVHFPFGLGITVRGVIRAVGTADHRIIFTREEKNSSFVSKDNFRNRLIRLIDGTSITDGKLQIFYKNRWRSVCTGYKNDWKTNDYKTVCHHLGFDGGEFYKWYDSRNESGQVYYSEPGCSGNEQSVTNCKWHRMKMGSGVCDGLPYLGIKCNPIILNSSSAYWRGIWFDNARKRQNADQKYKGIVKSYFVSESVLRFVNIYHAGCNKTGWSTSAISVLGTAPEMKNLNIRWSAYNGINISHTNDPITMLNSIINDNKGHGVFINSSLGSVILRDNSVTNNGGNGIHFVYHNGIYIRKRRVDFITDPDLGSSFPYPVDLIFSYGDKHLQKRKFRRTFSVPEDYRLTIHILSIFTSEMNSGEIIITDGKCDYSVTLLHLPIVNMTEAFSIVTTKNTVCIEILVETKRKILMHLQIDVGKDKVFDLLISNNTVTNNLGTGIFIQNMRSKILVSDYSYCAENKNGGIKLVNGSGDISIIESSVKSNIEDGINIMFNGGESNITKCQIMNNTGNGVIVSIRNSTQVSFLHHVTVISKSSFSKNKNIALLIGHHRIKPFINITMNNFFDCPEIVIMMNSDVIDSSSDLIKLLITHNKFFMNQKRSVYIPSAKHLSVVINNNEFSKNYAECLFIKGDVNDYVQKSSTDVLVNENVFQENQGPWIVYLILAETIANSLNFTRNILKNNVAYEPYSNLKSRSTTSAVVAVSSYNVYLYFNIFKNDLSLYELSSQLNGRYLSINASLNYWGSTNLTYIYSRIFDCKHRYNLGCVIFQPFFLIETDEETEYISNPQEIFIHQFQKGMAIGGEVLGKRTLEPGVYTVTEDIYIPPEGMLTIKEKTVLQFDQSIGMMVQGTLRAVGAEGKNNILFTYVKMPKENTSNSIRLGGNQHKENSFIHEGRVEIKINDQWGTICNKREWGIQEANIVCNQLGLVLNPNDWKVSMPDIFVQTDLPKILLSNVKCDHLFTYHLLDCKFETLNDFENMCTHKDDVAIRCYEPAWSGIRLGMMARSSSLKFLQIEKVGQFDYGLKELAPALQADFFQHNFDKLHILENRYIGIHLIQNNFYSESSLDGLVLKKNTFSGLVTHSPGIKISNSIISDQNENGLLYDPKIDLLIREDLFRWIKTASNRVLVFPSSGKINTRPLSRNQDIFIITQPSEENISSSVFIETTPDNILGIQIINPILDDKMEQIQIADMFTSEMNETWDLHKDLGRFPLRTKSSKIHIFHNSGKSIKSGSLLYVVAVEKTLIDTTGLSPKISIYQTTISNNYCGISVLHYSTETNGKGVWYPRYGNQSIEILNSIVMNNKESALSVDTPLVANVNNKPINVTYLLNSMTFINNSHGIMQRSHDILNSSVIFNWILRNNKFTHLTLGSLEITLPHVWQSSSKMLHKLEMVNNTFSNNMHFQLKLKGHYADVILSKNIFTENICNEDLIAIKGMEKEMQILHNNIEKNKCSNVIKFDIHSHAQISRDVVAMIKNNIIQENMLIHGSDSLHDSFTIGTIGIQKLIVNNNIFSRNKFHYEFFSGIQISSIKTFIDLKENWWGTSNSQLIQKNIYDFDDSNNYAPVIFTPYALSSSFVKMSSEIHNEHNISDLGGRIQQNVYLLKRSQPYRIKTDITIMPSASMVISPGVTIEFYPNVGILVLGKLVAIGTVEDPITFRPHQIFEKQPKYSGFNSRRLVRLCDDKNCSSLNKGFLEIFNTTINKWLPVCDDFFTELNGKIICSELHGKQKKINVVVKQAKKIFDIDYTDLENTYGNIYSKLCSGSENSYSECPERIDIVASRCTTHSSYTYIYCSVDDIPYSHWGGLSFSVPNYEYSSIRNDDIVAQYSILEHVKIIGAGSLHGQKSAAIQALYGFPLQINSLSVSNSASHGISIIAPMKDLNIKNSRIYDNFGVGINIISLNSATLNSLKSLKPLTDVNLPNEMFGLINICDSEKIVHIKERILLFYKYKNIPVNCVKTFVGDELLEFKFYYFNLFNTSLNNNSDYDVIKVYDGELFETSKNKSIQYGADSSESSQLFTSSQKILSVQMLASGASEKFGFLAEIHSVPPIIHLAHENNHVIRKCKLSKNLFGAISYSSVGETNPRIEISHNYMEENGLEMTENLTTSDAAVTIEVQNTRIFLFSNNALVKNQGGLRIIADSQTKPSALQSDITNNLFSDNRNFPVISGEGKSINLFQELKIHHNIITFNVNKYSHIMYLRKVMASFSNNFIYNNTGFSILRSELEDQFAQSNFQTFIQNAIFNNTSVNSKYLGTISIDSSGQNYHNNIFLNPLNDFEIVTSYYSNNGIVNASNNWWGYNDSVPISARILDAYDDHGKVTVVYKPFLQRNDTVVENYCPPKWTFIKKSCHLYIGGGLAEGTAHDFCQTQNAILARASAYNLKELVKMIEGHQINYDSSIPVRVQSVDIFPSHDCSGILHGEIKIISCDDNFPFICEWGSELADHNLWELNMALFVGSGVALVTVIVIACCLFWFCRKRSQRKAKLSLKHYQEKSGVKTNSANEELIYMPFIQSPQPIISNSQISGEISNVPAYVECVNTEEQDNYLNQDECSEKTEQYDSTSSYSEDDDEKKSLSHETLPLMEEKTVSSTINIQPKRYLETSLDDIDDKKRYLETSLDDLDQ